MLFEGSTGSGALSISEVRPVSTCLLMNNGLLSLSILLALFFFPKDIISPFSFPTLRFGVK